MIEKYLKIKLPRIVFDENKNFKMIYDNLNIKKKVDETSDIKDFLSDICIDIYSIITLSGKSIPINTKINYLKNDETFILSTYHFMLQYQHSYIDYLKKKNYDLVKNYNVELQNLKNKIIEKSIYINDIHNHIIYNLNTPVLSII